MKIREIRDYTHEKKMEVGLMTAIVIKSDWLAHCRRLPATSPPLREARRSAFV